MTTERIIPASGAARRNALGGLLAWTIASFAAPAMAQQQLPAPGTASGTAEAKAGSSASDGWRNELWLTSGFLTHHFQSDLNLNDNNRGAGVEYRATEALTLTAGRFYNSDRAHSRYLGVYYQPWTWGGWRFGAVAGGFDGYPRMREGGWFPAVIPAATFEYKRVGINVAVTPTYKDRIHGGISVQLKLRLF